MASATYDMSAPTSERKLSSRYVDYLAAYGRRLKRSAGGPSSDRAGRPCGEPYHGPVGPAKGKRAAPPPDGREASAHAGGVRMVAAAWARGAPTDVLCMQRPASAADATFRPSVRPFRCASASAMHGAAAVLDDEDEPHRAMRRHGVNAPTSDLGITKRRVHINIVPETTSREPWECEQHSSLRAWRMPSRPATADSIIRHRYSDPGTEAAPAKLDTARVPAPTVSRIAPEESRASFNCALDGYCSNKARALYGSAFHFN